jgi:phosphatidylglycerophosphate synthase
VTIVGPGVVAATALLERALETPAAPAGLVDVPAGAEWPRSGVLRARIAQAADVNTLLEHTVERQPDPRTLPSGEDVSHGRALLALRIADPSSRTLAEATILRATYKSTDNTLARFNRRLSLPISLALLRTPITANQLSIVLVAIGFYAAWLFSLGTYPAGVLAAALSLAASILDGCDGEIARLKYQESTFGCWLETIGDYSYYLAIFTGLTVGAVRHTGSPVFYWLGGMAMVGTLLSFALLIFLRNRITAGRPERLHAIAKQRFKAEPTRWSKLVWKLSFCATRSAMPYGIMFFALLGLLPAIVALAAIGANTYWVSLLLKLRHLLGEPAGERPAEA